jgi:CRISPR-associated protein Csb2
VLALGIRYLNGFAAASEPDDRERVEWPPHPGRVFMALAAAHFQTGAEPAEREALLWLEGLQAPAIKAPEGMPRAVVTHYVPVNDKAGPSKAILQSVPLTRDRQARAFARAWLESDTVYLLWPDAEPKDAIRSALEALCSKVSRIGHSSSLVQVWLAGREEAGEPNWIPDEEAVVTRVRIPSPGLLSDLERRFNAQEVERFADLKAAEADTTDRKRQKAAKERLKQEFPDGPPPQTRPSVSAYQGYGETRPKSTAVAQGTVFSPHLLVLKLEPKEAPYRHLDLASVLAVTDRWREALCSESNDLPELVRAVLSGHDPRGPALEGPHLAFLPLAFVGSHQHADGRLLGMALALPARLSREERRGVLTAISRVRSLALGRLGRMGVWRLETEAASRPPQNLRPEVWTAYPAGAMHWSTVTPVVYDRHPKTKVKAAYLREVAGMIEEASIRTGLPEPREVIVTPVSAHLGVPPAHAFPRLRRKDGSERRHIHAIVVFDQPVCGPVALGAGRFRGYGFFRPMEWPRSSKEGV